MDMKKGSATRLALSFVLAVCWSSACFATSNTVTIQGELQLGSNYIDFGQSAAGPFTPAPGSGVFQVTAIDPVGVFTTAGVTTGEMGTVQSLNQSPGLVMLPSAFITFNTGGSNLQLFATQILAEPFGAFQLLDVPPGVLGEFFVNGSIFNTGVQTGSFKSTFRVAFAGTTIAQLLGNQLPINAPFCAVVATSGDLSPAACNPFAKPASSSPEPASGFLLGGGS